MSEEINVGDIVQLSMDYITWTTSKITDIRFDTLTRQLFLSIDTRENCPLEYLEQETWIRYNDRELQVKFLTIGRRENTAIGKSIVFGKMPKKKDAEIDVEDGEWDDATSFGPGGSITSEIMSASTEKSTNTSSEKVQKQKHAIQVTPPPSKQNKVQTATSSKTNQVVASDKIYHMKKTTNIPREKNTTHDDIVLTQNTTTTKSSNLVTPGDLHLKEVGLDLAEAVLTIAKGEEWKPFFNKTLKKWYENNVEDWFDLEHQGPLCNFKKISPKGLQSKISSFMTHAFKKYENALVHSDKDGADGEELHNAYTLAYEKFEIEKSEKAKKTAKRAKKVITQDELLSPQIALGHGRKKRRSPVSNENDVHPSQQLHSNGILPGEKKKKRDLRSKKDEYDALMEEDKVLGRVFETYKRGIPETTLQIYQATLGSMKPSERMKEYDRLLGCRKEVEGYVEHEKACDMEIEMMEMNLQLMYQESKRNYNLKMKTSETSVLEIDDENFDDDGEFDH